MRIIIGNNHRKLVKSALALLLVVVLSATLLIPVDAAQVKEPDTKITIDDARNVAFNFAMSSISLVKDVSDFRWYQGMRFGPEDVLYDFDGNIAAYTFRFQSDMQEPLGYVTITSSLEEYPIIEFSYSINPVYEDCLERVMRMDELPEYGLIKSYIIYNGTLDYYLALLYENGNVIVADVLNQYPKIMTPEDIVNASRLKEAEPKDYTDDQKYAIKLEWENLGAYQTGNSNPPVSGSALTSPSSYESGYVSTTTNSILYTTSSYTYATTSSFTSPSMACAPTAAVNLFMWYNYLDSTSYSSLKLNGTWASTYSAMYAYMGTNGMWTLDSMILTGYTSFLNAVGVTYTTAYYMGPIIFSLVTGMTRPFHMVIHGHYYYGDHSVVTVGFVRFNYSDGSDSLYLRILDGWDTTAGRYVHNSVGSSRRVEGYSVTLA